MDRNLRTMIGKPPASLRAEAREYACLYMQGPWKLGVPSQGYQLPLTPAQLYRAGIEATNAHCVKTYHMLFDKLSTGQREEVLAALSTGKLDFGALPSRTFWTTVYQTVMEGM